MKNLNSLIIAVITILLFTNCSDFLEENPKSLASSETILASVEGMEAALLGPYGYLVGWNNYYSWDMLKLNESFVEYQYAPFDSSFSNGRIEAGGWSIRLAWERFYGTVSAANLVINNIGNIDGAPEQARIEGEAKFLRGWAYLHMVQFWGDIPLLLDPVSDPSSFQPERTPQAEVYDVIISDLTDAANMMGDDSPGLSRANKWIAKAYLAKTYVTMAGSPNNITTHNGTNTYALALATAKEIIASNRYTVAGVPYMDVFQTDNDAETIWELRVADIRNFNHYNFLTEAIMRPADDFLASFDANDVRGPGGAIDDSFVVDGVTFDLPHPEYLKFMDLPQKAAGQDWQSDMSVTAIRYADVLLMAAEADNEVNNEPSPDAYAYINEVRQRAGISDLSGLNYNQFIDAVFTERRKELYGEGHSWFDLKRFGRFSLLNNAIPARDYEVTIGDNLNYYPIYEAEITNNPNVTQNPGWPQ